MPIGGHDDVALPQAGPLGRRAVVDGVDAQALGMARDLQPDARELGVLRVLEALVLGGIEVVGEAVAELAHHAGDGVVGQRGFGDLAVVRVVHPVDRLLDDRGVAVADERVAHRSRQPVRVPAAQPGPEQQHDDHQGDERKEAGNGREPAQGPQGTRPHVSGTSGGRGRAMIGRG